MMPRDITSGETITADFLNRVKNFSGPAGVPPKGTQIFKYRITQPGYGKMMSFVDGTYDVSSDAVEEELLGADDLEEDDEVHVLFSIGSGRLEVLSGGGEGGGGGGGGGGGTACGPCGPRLNASLVTLPDGTKAAQTYTTGGFNAIFGIIGVTFEHLSGGEYVADDIVFDCPEDPPPEDPEDPEEE